ncbi:hypothetical protein B5M09_013860 [Aphanomyces astaci]|uniref:Transposase Tc1-like domain-containing protein n=1 Tax=Aphanomyces astaci TaxID=112090 RepID=A0A425DGT3_APHAT|nr:hypothetical protein B5M09_013860 [Aphanomyces astaci]
MYRFLAVDSLLHRAANEKLRTIPTKQHRSLRAVGHHLGVSHTTVRRLIKDKQIRVSANSLKPLLKPHNAHHINYCLEFVEHSNDVCKFNPMYSDVHLDRKWFWLDELTKTIYLGIDKEEPMRACHNTNFRTKVMFLCAVARPRLVVATGAWFDGKIAM